MPTKYVWWDDKRNDPAVRMQLRVPQSMQSFVQEVAETHDISINALMVAMLEYMLTATEEHQLVIDVGPNHIRLTPRLTASKTSDLTTPVTKLDRRFPYGKDKAR